MGFEPDDGTYGLLGFVGKRFRSVVGGVVGAGGAVIGAAPELAFGDAPCGFHGAFVLDGEAGIALALVVGTALTVGAALPPGAALPLDAPAALGAALVIGSAVAGGSLLAVGASCCGGESLTGAAVTAAVAVDATAGASELPRSDPAAVFSRAAIPRPIATPPPAKANANRREIGGFSRKNRALRFASGNGTSCVTGVLCEAPVSCIPLLRR